MDFCLQSKNVSEKLRDCCGAGSITGLNGNRKHKIQIKNNKQRNFKSNTGLFFRTTDKEKSKSQPQPSGLPAKNVREMEHDPQVSSNLNPSINIKRNFVKVNSFYHLYSIVILNNCL